MASVHDVAAYILKSQGEITTWKFQKLVYYSQAWSLAWDERPLFEARIEAWENGPVVPELYRHHRRQYSVKRWPQGDASKLKKDEQETVDSVLASYGQMSGRQLSILTHNEAPWKKARAGLGSTDSSNQRITPEAMQSYYTWLDANGEATSVEDIDWSSLETS